MPGVNAATNDAGSRRPPARGGLNFWQWLGLLIIVGIGFWLVYKNYIRPAEPEPNAPLRQNVDEAPTQAQGEQLPAASEGVE